MRHEDAAPGAGGGQGLALINPTAPRVYPKAELENETTFDDDTRGQAASDPQGEARGLWAAYSRLAPWIDVNTRRGDKAVAHRRWPGNVFSFFRRPTNLKPEKPLRVAISPRLLPRADHTRIAGAQVLDSDP